MCHWDSEATQQVVCIAAMLVYKTKQKIVYIVCIKMEVKSQRR